jgi:hypothetical protein
MPPFNASRKVQKLRLESYQYVDLVPRDEPIKGIPVGPEGAELHHDSGRVQACNPGDWLVEFPDGTLQRMTAETVLALYEVPASAQPAQNTADGTLAHGVTNPRAATQAAAPSTTEHTDDGGFIPVAGEDERKTQARRRHAAAQPGTPMTEAEKAAAQQAIADYAQEARRLAIRLSQQAMADGLIDQHEQHDWVNTGALPDGVAVTALEDGNYAVSRTLPDVQPDDDQHEEDVEGEAEGDDDQTTAEPEEIPIAEGDAEPEDDDVEIEGQQPAEK